MIVKKRGRKPKWVPEIVTEGHRKVAKKLEDLYAPQDNQAKRFEEVYLSFCTVNNLDPSSTESAVLAIGQAVSHGAAISSLKTNFISLFARKRIRVRDEWKVRTMLSTAHADGDDVQPRTYAPEREHLRTTVESIEDEDMQALAWLCFVSGSRAVTMARLRRSQIVLEEEQILLQRRWSKVARNRNQRDVLAYRYEWTMAPPLRVVSYLTDRAHDHSVWLLPKALKSGRAAGMLTRILRKETGLDDITSYAFRDYLDNRLEQLGIDPDQRERLMEHSEKTARACYRSSKISSAQAKEAKKKKAAKKSSKKEK